MKKIITITLLFATSFLLAFHSAPLESAINFLNSLNQNQRTKAQLPFDDVSKSTWHYIPGSMWPRKGVSLADLDGNQKKLLHNLLQNFLSETGYKKTVKIIDLENVLLEQSGNSIRRDPEKYFVAFYGNPKKDSLWSWSFEGHHISLNFTVLNGKTSIAPRFLGANPATIQTGIRKGERTLNREDDLGLKLINSLNKEQREIAIFQKKPFSDIVTGNSIEVQPIKPIGIKFKELKSNQQVILLELLDEYLSTLDIEQAHKRIKKIRSEEIDVLSFGWAGATILGEGHYYRIQGKSFLIEFDNTQNNANHIHTVWRDFDGDFGRDLIIEHYKNSNHHKN